MVDVLSGGRLEFGIGLGNAPKDPVVYGILREDRRDRFEEAMQVIKAAWSQDRFNHQGRFWQLEDVAVYPRPVQQPHPPFWAAAGSLEAMQWAGRHGMDVMTVAHPFPPERMQGLVPAWRQALAEAGHDPSQRHCKIHIRVWVDEQADRARRVAEEAIERYDAYSRDALGRRAEGLPASDWNTMLEQGRNVYGTPDQCIRYIENTRRNYEFDIFSATFNFGGIPHEEILGAMRLFAKEVMPAFQDEATPAHSRPAAAR
jgi:alkanesulfonate monooxygenase SsuD/methylene tetrahydromethanopterin reductase-like flavin-dependent oxidoreductase (luciferase family)